MSGKFYKLPHDIAERKDLTASEKIVWAVLADRVGNNGRCWPGVRTLAKDTGLSASTVLRAITGLEEKCLWQVQRRGTGRVNYYRLTDQSAVKMRTLPEQERSQNDNTGVRKMRTEALSKCEHNQTDQLNQTSDAVRLAELLLSEIRKRKADFKKPNLEAWTKQIDLMLRRDKRTPERIEAVIRWTQQDIGDGGGFGWANNILSTAKLREKFDRLELDMQKRPGLPTAEPVRRGRDGLTARERALKGPQND